VGVGLCELRRHMSHATSHISHVTTHMSHVTQHKRVSCSALTPAAWPACVRVTRAQIRYWTDNGAYYYYMTSNTTTAAAATDAAAAATTASAAAAPPSASGSMQDTVLAVLDYWSSLNLPLRHLMYDSWWYVPRRTSHFTRHTSHVTRHTSHVTRHSSHLNAEGSPDECVTCDMRGAGTGRSVSRKRTTRG